MISNKDKITEIALPGNLISISTDTCKVYGEGKITFGENIGQVSLESVGNINYDMKENKLDFNLMIGMDFFFSDGALKVMAEELKSEITIVLVTNLVQQARRLSTRAAFFLMGECVEVNSTENLFTRNTQDKRTLDYVEGRFG